MLATTIKHVKQAISILLTILLVSSNAVAAQGDYARGIAAVKRNNLQQAEKYFKAVERTDSDYTLALEALEDVKNQQEKRRNEAITRREIEQCRKLYATSSPQAPDCVQELRTKWGNDVFADTSEHGVSDLVAKEKFSREYDTVAYGVTRPVSGTGMEQISAYVSQLELWSKDMTIADGYREGAKDRLGHYYLGRFQKGNENCEVLWKDGKGETESARQICGEAIADFKNYERVTQNINLKAIEGGIPAKSHELFVPLTKHPDASSLVIFDPSKAAMQKPNTNRVIIDDNVEKNQGAAKEFAQSQHAESSSMPMWIPVAAAGTVVAIIVGVVVHVMTKKIGQASPMAHAALPATAAAVASVVTTSAAVLAVNAPNMEHLAQLVATWTATRAPVREAGPIITYLATFGLKIVLSDDRRSFTGPAIAITVGHLHEALSMVLSARR